MFAKQMANCSTEKQVSTFFSNSAGDFYVKTSPAKTYHSRPAQNYWPFEYHCKIIILFSSKDEVIIANLLNGLLGRLTTIYFMHPTKNRFHLGIPQHMINF